MGHRFHNGKKSLGRVIYDSGIPEWFWNSRTESRMVPESRNILEFPKICAFLTFYITGSIIATITFTHIFQNKSFHTKQSIYLDVLIWPYLQFLDHILRFF